MDSDDNIVTSHRISNIKNRNEESIFVDREGKLIFTTKLIDQTISINVETLIFSGANYKPDTVNIIIDCITFFSTNPNVQNYTPLQINIFGSNPIIEFGDVDLNPLTDYKIINEPELTNDTIINRRYTSPKNVACNWPANALELLEVTIIKDKILLTFNDSINPAPSKITRVYNLNDDTFVDHTSNYVLPIISSDSLAVAFSSDLINPKLINVLDGTIISTYTGKTPIRLMAVDNNLIVAVNTPNGLELIFYVITNGNFILTNGYVDTDGLVTDIDNFYVTNIFYILRANNRVDKLQFNLNDTVNSTIFANQAPIGSKRIFVGGSFFSEPVLTYINDTGRATIKTSDNFSAVLLLGQINNKTLRKRKNQIVFQNGTSDLYRFYNVDTYQITDFVIGNENFFLPRSLVGVDLSDDYFIVGGYFQMDSINLLLFTNSRDKKEVYQLTYNYDERTYVYQVSSSNFGLTIALPNKNPIIDMELFQYVIDLRIKYSKNKRKISNITNTNKGMTEISTSILNKNYIT